MSDSPAGSQAIIDRMRGQAIRPDARSITQFAPFVMLDHAVAAVHAAADTRTREIAEWLHELADPDDGRGGALTLDDLLARFESRFPLKENPE